MKRWRLRFWRMTQLLRTSYFVLRSQGGRVLFVRVKLWLAGERTYFFAKYDGVEQEVQQITYSDKRPAFTKYPVLDQYYRRHLTMVEPDAHALATQIMTADTWENPPQLSILTPVFNTPIDILQATVDSVRAQTYPYWEWVIVDASPNHVTWDYLTTLMQDDHRIQCHRIINEGISANTNAALTYAQADYVVLLDHDDTLRPFALFAVAECIRQHPDADLIYSDEDKIDEQERRCEPFYKPDWSPELMLCANMVTHLAVIRRELLQRIGGFNLAFDGAQDWDVFLRVSEHTDAIYHIPQVLYHWRKTTRSTAQNIGHKPGITKKQCQLVIEHLKRIGIQEPKVYLDTMDPIHRTHPIVQWQPQGEYTVSIIIPSKDQHKLLGYLLKTLFEKTAGVTHEVILVDTGSQQAATQAIYDTYLAQPNFKLVHYTEPFNFSRACNFGASFAQGNLLLFLNNDMEVINADWLQAMVQWFDLPQVGIVGSLLLYPDKRVQHAGVTIGLGGMAAHLFRAKSPDVFSPLGAARWYRNLSAVTGACLLIRRDVFDTVGQFEEAYSLNYSDVDLCAKVTDAGYRVVYTPRSILIHHENITHGGAVPRQDFEVATERLRHRFIAEDPYFNPNLSYSSEMPKFKQVKGDIPRLLNEHLMAALPYKAMITLPDDLKKNQVADDAH